MCCPPKTYPIFQRNGSNNTFKNSCPKIERIRIAISLVTCRVLYPLSHTSKRGFSLFTPDLWEFCKKGDFSTGVVFISVEKSKSSRKIFEKKLFKAIISGKVQGVVGGGENLFSTHVFFYFFFTTL